MRPSQLLLDLRRIENVAIERNPDWLESVRLGLKIGVFYAPLTLWLIVLKPALVTIINIAIAILATIGLIAAWMGARVVYLALGIFGLLARPAEKKVE